MREKNIGLNDLRKTIGRFIIRYLSTNSFELSENSELN